MVANRFGSAAPRLHRLTAADIIVIRNAALGFLGLFTGSVPDNQVVEAVTKLVRTLSDPHWIPTARSASFPRTVRNVLVGLREEGLITSKKVGRYVEWRIVL